MHQLKYWQLTKAFEIIEFKDEIHTCVYTRRELVKIGIKIRINLKDFNP
jgi:hypothetical protein